MSSGGRKLQDIFDGGTRKLEQHEQSEKQRLETLASMTVEACGRKESQVMQRMDVALASEEAQIHSFTTPALEVIQAAIAAEQEENDRFYASLTDSLRLSLKSLTEDIARVKDSLLQTSSNDAEYRLAIFEADLRTLMSHLRTSGLQAAEELRVQARQRHLEFSRKLETIAAQLVERESRVDSEVHAEFAAHGEAAQLTLETHATYFSDVAEQHLTVLDNAARELAQSIQAKAEEHAAELEKAYSAAEANLRSSYQSVLSDGLVSRSTLSRDLFDELQRGLESHRIELAGRLTEFRADSEEMLEQLKNTMATHDFEVREKTGELTSRIDDTLTGRLDAARANRDTVSKDRLAMLQKISQDLGEIESGFEKRLSDISRDCLSRLSTICLEAENSIIAAHDNCIKEFKTMAQTTQSDMEERSERLLSELEEAERVAIARIREAAGETGDPQ